AVSFLESSKPTILRFGLRITAAATTGPNSAPRPASSSPAMRVQPSFRAARSKREQQSRAIFVECASHLTMPTEPRALKAWHLLSFCTRGLPALDAHRGLITFTLRAL